MRVAERKKLAEIQDLIGKAHGCYQNDRDPNRAEHVTQPLDRAFNLCVEILGAYPVLRSKQHAKMREGSKEIQ